MYKGENITINKPEKEVNYCKLLKEKKEKVEFLASEDYEMLELITDEEREELLNKTKEFNVNETDCRQEYERFNSTFWRFFEVRELAVKAPALFSKAKGGKDNTFFFLFLSGDMTKVKKEIGEVEKDYNDNSSSLMKKNITMTRINDLEKRLVHFNKNSLLSSIYTSDIPNKDAIIRYVKTDQEMRGFY